VGAGKRDAEITIRELCLLHGRDPLGTPRQSVETVLRERSDPITWTDLEELLVHGRSNQRLLDYLQGRDRIDDEKWAFGHAAFDFLEKRAAHLPGGLEIAVYDSIWDVVWSHPWLDRGERYIFRGQVDSRWSLSPSLFRPGGVLPPDVGTLLKRIELTEAFVRELRGARLSSSTPAPVTRSCSRSPSTTASRHRCSTSRGHSLSARSSPPTA
jgi:hypothetical protein